MQPVPQDLLKEYVQSQHFTSTTEIMAAMKEMFRDVIQTVMEVEMDEELGRERCERSDAPEGTARNYRNGYTKKTVKQKSGFSDRRSQNYRRPPKTGEETMEQRIRQLENELAYTRQEVEFLKKLQAANMEAQKQWESKHRQK